MKNILITGGAGFFGREFIRQLRGVDCGVVAICHSEGPARNLELKYKNLPIYCLDVAYNKNNLDFIIKEHNIDYVIHAAAMKHVGLCEKNPYKAIETNILGSKNIIDLCKENDIKNAIAMSTDKAIDPTCVYGTTKYLMERMFLEKNYSVFRGVNFLFSDGSVLDIWDNQRINKQDIGVNSRNTVRYFVHIEDIVSFIIKNLDSKSQFLVPDKCYKIKIHDLAKAFCSYHNYYHVKDYVDFNVEKLEEQIPDGIEIVETEIKSIIGLLQKHYNSKR
jgi:FlaA1/EpsC-like NDP-sugar epimerase